MSSRLIEAAPVSSSSVACACTFAGIQSDTARIIWSWGDADPLGPNGLSKHMMQGATSINLLGGLNEELSELQIPDTHFDIRNENVSYGVWLSMVAVVESLFVLCSCSVTPLISSIVDGFAL